jgi:hypothetical protein
MTDQAKELIITIESIKAETICRRCGKINKSKILKRLIPGARSGVLQALALRDGFCPTIPQQVAGNVPENQIQTGNRSATPLGPSS